MPTIGVISDTHGPLPAAAADALQGVDAILHAGDIGDPMVLTELGWIAPVTAVRGNNDTEAPLRSLPPVVRTGIAGTRFLMTHEPRSIGRRSDAALEDVDVVVTGHTHRALVERRGSVLWVNPGSARLPRGGGGPTVAIVEVGDGPARARIVRL